MVFRLRYLHHDFELPPGRFLIGRSTECQLSLDDPLVSRKHAMLAVADEMVEVQDLGSRNGVLVNGEKIVGVHRLAHGDRITVGSQEMTLSVTSTAGPPTRRASDGPGISPVTITAMAPVRPPPDSAPVPTEPREHEATSKADAFRLLGGVADKALALGRAEEAERLLSTLLDHVLRNAQAGLEVEPVLLERAGHFGARLAAATAKGRWVDYVIELHTAMRRPCAGPTIDELHGALRKIKEIDLPSLRAYVDLMRDMSSKMGPADRFLVQRLEGLERLVALQ